ncbi:MAG: hypothetical protein HFE83_03780 [Lachnospiraceae bacterium]|jgi:hypothetical protein|nr:hypothetical protein [Lachnospiraceae bacterium]
MSRYKASMTLKKEQIDRLYEGSIDMHVHVAPDPDWDRRLNTLETARFAEAGGMQAFVAKSFYYPTTTEALLVSGQMEQVTVFGSVTIGYGTTGGLENAALTIENHAKLGCRVVWFPAFDAAYCRRGIGRDGGICILDESGALKQEAKDVLAVAKKYDIVVCKGHMSYPETKALFEEAIRLGITRLVNTHPLSDSWGVFTKEEIRYLADLGAYTEIVFGNLMPRLDAMDPSDYVDLVHELGAQRMIMSTDLAQCMDPTPAEGMRFFIGTMLQFGCTDEEVEWMAKKNPSKLLGITE